MEGNLRQLIKQLIGILYNSYNEILVYNLLAVKWKQLKVLQNAITMPSLAFHKSILVNAFEILIQ